MVSKNFSPTQTSRGAEGAEWAKNWDLFLRKGAKIDGFGQNLSPMPKNWKLDPDDYRRIQHFIHPWIRRRMSFPSRQKSFLFQFVQLETKKKRRDLFALLPIDCIFSAAWMKLFRLLLYPILVLAPVVVDFAGAPFLHVYSTCQMQQQSEPAAVCTLYTLYTNKSVQNLPFK